MAEYPLPGVDCPRAWHELLAWFPDDASCLRYLERLRWGDGFVCRFCATVGGGWWQRADGLRRCALCRRDTSVTAGTIFAGTRTPLTSWFARLVRRQPEAGRQRAGPAARPGVGQL
jgi:Transposase zinc-ribbon domain